MMVERLSVSSEQAQLSSVCYNLIILASVITLV